MVAPTSDHIPLPVPIITLDDDGRYWVAAVVPHRVRFRPAPSPAPPHSGLKQRDHRNSRTPPPLVRSDGVECAASKAAVKPHKVAVANE